MSEFKDLNIPSAILKALDAINIIEPTQIQEQSIPLLLEGNDVIGQAQTGTGKTFAYSIPLINKIDSSSKNVEALVLCPTRELGIQVAREIEKLLVNERHIKLATIYGGESYEKQFRELKRCPQIVVGTPGRIIDHLNRGKLSFANIKYLVLDEADEMLKMGFQEDLETILSNMPEERQTALFSATMPPFIKSVSTKYMKDPKVVKIEAKTLTVDRIDEKVYYCMKDDKKDLVVRLIDFFSFKSIMIFCNTKSMVDELTLYLQNLGYRADGLHGDLKQTSRDRVMTAFRNQSVSILIATDVAARGIDVEGIDAVINFDIPNENEIYVHRIGRTARAGREGVAITLSTIRGKGRIRELEDFTKRKMTKCQIPTKEDIMKTKEKKFYLQLVEGIEANKDNHDYDALLMKLSRISTDPMPLFTTLMKMIDTDSKEYPEIVDLSLREDKSKSRDRNKDKRGASKDQGKSNGKNDSKNFKDKNMKPFSIVEVNIGEADKVRPNQLVNFFHDELKIHREHFGKIVINNKKSYIEVKSEALRFFKDINKVRFNKRPVTCRVVDKFPR